MEFCQSGKVGTLHFTLLFKEVPFAKYIHVHFVLSSFTVWDIWHILQQLTGQKATTEHAASLLDKRFNTPEPRREPVVLLVDEVCYIMHQQFANSSR